MPRASAPRPGGAAASAAAAAARPASSQYPPAGHGDDDDDDYEPRDTRFTIDDEDDDDDHEAGSDGEDHDDGRRGLLAGSADSGGPGAAGAASQHRGYDRAASHVEGEEDDGADGEHKYPPSAPPPSYHEAIASGSSSSSPSSSRGRSSRGVLGSLRARARSFCVAPAFLHEVSRPSLDMAPVRRFGWKAWGVIMHLWPTSRLAQASLFLVGLWALILVSGPAFDDPSAIGVGGAGAGGLAYQAPQFDMADPANQQGPPPISGDGGIVQHANWSIESCISRGLWLSAECTSSTTFNLTVPISFAGTAKLAVFADPERPKGMSKGRGSVIGWVRLRTADSPEEAASLEGQARAVVRARYPIQASNMLKGVTVGKLKANLEDEGIGIYSHQLPTRLRHNPPLSFEVILTLPPDKPVPALVVDSGSMDVALFNIPDRSAIKAQPPPFGRIEIKTSHGVIYTPPDLNLEARAHILLKSTKTNLEVGGRMRAQRTELHSRAGHVTILEDAQIEGWNKMSLEVHAGDVFLRRGAVVRGTTVKAEIFGAGRIHGTGLWSTNSTLDLEAAMGDVDAHAELRRPMKGPKGSVAVLNARAAARLGNVKLRFVNQQEGTSLHADAETHGGSAYVWLPKWFEGQWHLEGQKRGSRFVEPAPEKALGRTWEQESEDQEDQRVAISGWVGKEHKKGGGIVKVIATREAVVDFA